MSKFYPLSVAKVRNETRDTIVVTFAVPPELTDSFRFQQGQHPERRGLPPHRLRLVDLTLTTAHLQGAPA